MDGVNEDAFTGMKESLSIINGAQKEKGPVICFVLMAIHENGGVFSDRCGKIDDLLLLQECLRRRLIEDSINKE